MLACDAAQVIFFAQLQQSWQVALLATCFLVGLVMLSWANGKVGHAEQLQHDRIAEKEVRRPRPLPLPLPDHAGAPWVLRARARTCPPHNP